MPLEDNPVGAEMVRRIAALARLRVPERDLPALTGQLARIVSYIDQLKEIAQEPALRKTGTVVEVAHPERGKYLTVGNPIKLSDSPVEVRRSPLLGEHTEEILRNLVGMNENDIHAARQQGVI